MGKASRLKKQRREERERSKQEEKQRYDNWEERLTVVEQKDYYRERQELVRLWNQQYQQKIEFRDECNYIVEKLYETAYSDEIMKKQKELGYKVDVMKIHAYSDENRKQEVLSL